MNANFNIWEFVGGLGLFLFAMMQLETALRAIAGRSLRRFLQAYTSTSLKSISVGTVATGFLQSSSLVGLMVLAFAGAGIMSLQNALGVIFGANLGTTVTGWIVTALGFKLELDKLALPLVGIGGLLLVGLSGAIANAGRIMTALGFLLMGLAFMKDSAASLQAAVDVQRLGGLALWQYLAFGFVFAAVIRSSSATMMVALAALHDGVIGIPAAAAVAVGADLGTTTTIVIGALNGASVKRRIALAHVIFNVTTALIAFVALRPLLDFVALIGVRDPLFSLVAFHSLFNLIGIVLFLPFMGLFARFLERRFRDEVEHESRFVSSTTPTVADAALVAIEEETAHIIGRVIRQNMLAFTPPLPQPPGRPPVELPAPKGTEPVTFEQHYRATKRLEGEILSFGLKVQAQPLEPGQSVRLNQLLSAVREAVHSAKSLRDIRHNLDEFADSPRPDVNAYVDHFRSVMTAFYGEVYRLSGNGVRHILPEDLDRLLKRVDDWHNQLHGEVYSDIHGNQLDESEISSLLNVNREVYHSNRALVLALQEYHAEAVGESRPQAAAT